MFHSLSVLITAIGCLDTAQVWCITHHYQLVIVDMACNAWSTMKPVLYAEVLYMHYAECRRECHEQLKRQQHLTCLGTAYFGFVVNTDTISLHHGCIGPCFLSTGSFPEAFSVHTCQYIHISLCICVPLRVPLTRGSYNHHNKRYIYQSDHRNGTRSNTV